MNIVADPPDRKSKHENTMDGPKTDQIKHKRDSPIEGVLKIQ
jgi:hypothetical protein